jgi:L-alanine-DL-glutamate epimerase-like enolase superfamily enzyme
LRDPFVIARSDHGGGREVTTTIVELRDDRAPGLVGVGEGYPDSYYGETIETLAAVWPLLLEAIGQPELTPDGLAGAADAMNAAIVHHGAAKCALDIALHDLAAKVAGLPLHAFLGLGRELPPTDFTIGIDTPEVVAGRAARAARFPALKIKVGGPADLATLEAVRAVFDGPIRVDANTGWSPDDAVALLPHLERLGVELIEQPFRARRLDQLRWLQERSSLPIVADESAVTIDDLDALVGVVAGVNVKLAKCGGVGPAMRMLERARELGFRTFLGCMEETSVGIAASAAVASLADWVDLDGNLLLAADPFSGLELGPDCRWQLPERAGLGLERKAS